MALKEEDATRNALVIEGTRIGVWDWNIQTGETFFNERWAEIIGYTKAELEPVSIDTWVKFAHPDDLETSNQLLQAHFDGKSDYYEFESRMKHKEGHWVWVYDRGKVFEWDEEGKPLRMCGSHTDITSIKRREEAAFEAKQKFQKVFEISDIGMTLTNEEGHIIDCNKASERMLGITKEEHLARDYDGKEWNIIRMDGSTMPVEEYASVRALTQRTPITGQVMGIVTSEDDVTWLSVDATPLDTPGFGVLIAYFDITKQVVYQQKLEEANQTKDKFFSIIAHDIKSPLTGILGLIELSRMSLEKGDTQEVLNYLEMMQHSTKEGTELLDNLLNWSRVQANRIEFNPKKMELESCIERTAALMKAPMEEKKIRLNLNHNGRLPVLADEYMIKTTLRNLLSNAIKFSKERSHISIHTQDIGKDIQVAIEDEGIGIPSELVQDFFDMKEMNTRVGTNGEKGTGLGLTLCRDFIRMNGGNIWVESEENKGSTFYFTLPKAD